MDVRRAAPRPSRIAAIAVTAALCSVIPIMGPTSGVASTTPAVPAFSHIYVIVMENHEYGSIIGSSQAPYVNALIKRYGLATNYTAVSHPSEPNYLALWGGSTYGVHDDAIHNIAGRNLSDQIGFHGRTWHVYAQDLPKLCSTVASASGGVDLLGAAGEYVRKHEPAISFSDISKYRTRCDRITGLGSFSATKANFELIVPNMTNDMHDGSIAQGDAFLKAFIPKISRTVAFRTSLIIITWDEGSTNIGGGGKVATILMSPRVPVAKRSSIAHNHYSLLRTIEDAWGLGCINQTCTANDLREFFH